MVKPRGKRAGDRRCPAPAPLQDDEHLSNEEAAAFLRISPETLLTWRCRKRGPAYYKIGRFAYYKVEDLKAWREAQRRDPQKAAA